MNAPLDELYFEWLYRQVSSLKLKNPTRTYWNLFRILYTHEFVWIIPNDDNRCEDGKDLRYEFIRSRGDEPADYDQHWLHMGCSMLELLIGLSRRLAFEMNSEPDEWFWELLENLELKQYNDSVHVPRKLVEERLDRVIFRTYRRNGRGGLFPLKRPYGDQRDVELWYQLNAYILELEQD